MPTAIRPQTLCPYCPCDIESMPGAFKIDANDQIGNSTCNECMQLNSRNAGKQSNCTYFLGTTICAPFLPGFQGISITLSFSPDPDTNRLTVDLEFRVGSSSTVLATYQKKYTTNTSCNQSHTLDKQTGDSTCTWPTSIVVSPVT